LLSYGDVGVPSIVESLALDLTSARQPPQLSALYTGMGGGTAWFSGHGAERSTAASQLTVVEGLHMTPQFDLVFEAGGLLDADYSPDPMVTQDMLVVLVGI